MLGVDPSRWALGELLATAYERLLSQWDQVATIVWATVEVNRDRKQRPQPYLPSDFNPLRLAQAKQAAEQPGTRRLSSSMFRADARKYYEQRGEPIPDELRGD